MTRVTTKPSHGPRRVHVQICHGLVCAPLGSMEIQKAVQTTCERLGVELDLTPHHCCSRCQNEEGLCPSVRIDDDWMRNATPALVKQHLVQKLAEAGGEELAQAQDPFAKYFGTAGE